MLSIKKILVSTDFSDPSRRAIEYAVSMQKVFDAELELVHVIFDETYLITSYVPQGTLQGFLGELEAGAEQHLDSFIDSCDSLKGVKFSKRILKGTPYAEITDWAAKNETDLIIIGTHGRTGLDHMLFGSTAEKVIGRASCPVLTVK
jgi:nucleotide-binding universal stress UspA family protein